MPGVGAARRRTWIVSGLVALAVVASSVTWLVVSRAGDREERLAANQRQLARACAGLLPRELGAFVPDDKSGVLDEFGTMLSPREESRALLDCTLSWGGGDDAWEPDAQARVRAEAALTRTAPPPSDGSFGLPLPDSALGTVSTDDRLTGSTVSASLLADCPKGLTGRVRPSRDLLVTVDLPSAEDEYDVPEADRLLAARTAVRVADWVAKKQGCGGAPLRSASGAAAPAKVSKLCAWLSAKALPLAPGEWTFDGNMSTYSRRTGACGGRWDDPAGSPAELTVKAVGAESWSGVLAGGAYESHRGNARVPGADDPAAAGEPVTIQESGDDPLLALWARSQCVAGPTYHRVTVTPQLSFTEGTREGTAVLEPKERRQLSRKARAVLDRYLAAPDGWPRRAHCRDTKVMGEVAQWRG
ncbi:MULTISPECIES: hypothetical protein [Streptomyces]|uniref:hypothetical protein n=1 Tax=Streptomyces TaxID=1883 RepID=UPI001E2C9551|nr:MULTISPECIES: hypothetical protein [Streptomyces]UFQ18843.1 hypothetical protein J2N69_29825 [Streptomyces huasconensis]WCL88460.1 hypothetical protein PPN52_29790 [Streptomyces sp. JCM 35825]